MVIIIIIIIIIISIIIIIIIVIIIIIISIIIITLLHQKVAQDKYEISSTIVQDKRHTLCPKQCLAITLTYVDRF